MAQKSAKRRKVEAQLTQAMSVVLDDLASLSLRGSMGTKLQSDDEPEYIVQLDLQSSCKGSSDAKVAAAYSGPSVGIYSVSELKLLTRLEGHKDLVTGIKFSHGHSNMIYTSSQDKTLRCWDLRTQKPTLNFTGYHEADRRFTSIGISSDDTLLCAGTEAGSDEDVYMIFWDVRKPEPVGYYRDSHHDDITQVNFHPSRSELLLTGSMDGLLCYFDVNEACEDDALLYTHNCNSSVNTAGWWGKDCLNVFACTHDGGVSAYNAEGDVELCFTNALEAAKDIASDYVIDCLPNGEALYALLGTHSGELSVHLLGAGNQELRSVATLGGGHAATVRCSAWDEEKKILYTGGEDSKLVVWGLGRAADAPSVASR